MSSLAELAWLLPPLAMCLVLTGIHGYLGIHVLSRKVIFVDLALAQFAALGSTYAVLLGYDPANAADGLVVYAFSLGFTFVGAAVFSLARMRSDKVPQEAFIGIAYATASALALLLLAKSAGEAEHIKQMLVGNVLLVTWPQVMRTAALYAAVGAFHFAFRQPFFEISSDPEAAAMRGRAIRWWDFLFYASFGFVITSSVAIAGVLLVFTFLVVPGVMAFMFFDSMRARVVLAWLIGTLGSALGMSLSYYGDLPTGPSVVACFAALLLVASAGYYVRSATHRLSALIRVLGGVAIAGALLGSSFELRKPEAGHAHEASYEGWVAGLSSAEESAQIDAIHHLGALGDSHAVLPLTALLASSPSERVAEHLVEELPKFSAERARSVRALEDYALRNEDAFLELGIAASLLELQSVRGLELLSALLAQEPPALVAVKASALLMRFVGDDFGLAAGTDDAARVQSGQRFAAWLSEHGGSLRYRPERKRFE